MPFTDITLNGIALSGLTVANEFEATGVRSEVARTLAGGLVIWETFEPIGKNIDLVGESDSGWLTRSTIKSLLAQASVPGATYSLVLADRTATVRFRNEEPPAIECTPIVARQNHADTDYYYQITIKLMEV